MEFKWEDFDASRPYTRFLSSNVFPLSKGESIRHEVINIPHTDYSKPLNTVTLPLYHNFNSDLLQRHCVCKLRPDNDSHWHQCSGKTTLHQTNTLYIHSFCVLSCVAVMCWLQLLPGSRLTCPVVLCLALGLGGGLHREEHVGARFMPPEKRSPIKFKSRILCCFSLFHEQFSWFHIADTSRNSIPLVSLNLKEKQKCHFHAIN